MTNTATATLTTFVFLVEGEPYVGTVVDLAKALENAHYADLNVDRTVWTFANGKPEACVVQTQGSSYNEDDYAYVTVELEWVKDNPETASFRLDGRS